MTILNINIKLKFHLFGLFVSPYLINDASRVVLSIGCRGGSRRGVTSHPPGAAAYFMLLLCV